MNIIYIYIVSYIYIYASCVCHIVPLITMNRSGGGLAYFGIRTSEYMQSVGKQYLV